MQTPEIIILIIGILANLFQIIGVTDQLQGRFQSWRAVPLLPDEAPAFLREYRLALEGSIAALMIFPLNGIAITLICITWPSPLGVMSAAMLGGFLGSILNFALIPNHDQEMNGTSKPRLIGALSYVTGFAAIWAVASMLNHNTLWNAETMLGVLVTMALWLIQEYTRWNIGYIKPLSELLTLPIGAATFTIFVCMAYWIIGLGYLAALDWLSPGIACLQDIPKDTLAFYGQAFNKCWAYSSFQAKVFAGAIVGLAVPALSKDGYPPVNLLRFYWKRSRMGRALAKHGIRW